MIPRGCLYRVETRNVNPSNPSTEIQGNKTCVRSTWVAPKPGLGSEERGWQTLKTVRAMAPPGLKGRILGKGNGCKKQR